MKKLDMLGQPCPIPVINAKKALAEPEYNEVEVLVDNLVAVQNLEKMAKGYGYAFAYSQPGERVYSVKIDRNGKPAIPPPALATTAGAAGRKEAPAGAQGAADPAQQEGPVVLVTSNALGSGSDELGRMLMKGFVFSLTQLSPAPAAVLFLNGGAHLTTQGANTVQDLQALEALGVEVLTCGTCANYYGLQDKLAVGKITDMMGITSRLAAAAKRITV